MSSSTKTILIIFGAGLVIFAAGIIAHLQKVEWLAILLESTGASVVASAIVAYIVREDDPVKDALRILNATHEVLRSCESAGLSGMTPRHNEIDPVNMLGFLRRAKQRIWIVVASHQPWMDDGELPTIFETKTKLSLQLVFRSKASVQPWADALVPRLRPESSGVRVLSANHVASATILVVDNEIRVCPVLNSVNGGESPMFTLKVPNTPLWNKYLTEFTVIYKASQVP